jgi:AraC-like DNA-binding protein
MFSRDFQEIENARIAMVIYILIFLCWLLLKALHAPEIFRGIDSKLRLIRNITEEEKKELTIQRNIEELKSFMNEKEPYLNPNLTIQNLADQLNKPVRELSILINYNFDQHFYDFINSYRIEKAKKLLKNTSSKDLMVFEIFYDVGFNSKSSFNTAFKKQVGKTPTQYRKTS